jgi:hypothetical protein
MSLEDRLVTRRTALGLTGGIALSAGIGSLGADFLNSNIAHNQMKSDVESVRLERIGRYKTGLFDGGAEDVAYYPEGQRLFVVSTTAGASQVVVLDVSDPSDLVRERILDVSEAYDATESTNSIDVSRGIVAVIATSEQPQTAGRAIFYDAASLDVLITVEVGSLPDMVTFTPNGNYVLVANVGAPTESTNQRGSVSVIDLRDGIEELTVSTASFEKFDGREDQLREEGIRIYERGANANPVASRALAPAYIAPTDTSTAFVSLSLNNALATLDVSNAEITRITGLGTKDFGAVGYELDTSTVDGPSLQNWPLRGFYQPDGITAYTVDGDPYVLTANEGASRAFEEVQVADLNLDPEGFQLTEYPAVDSVAALKKPVNLGQLTVTNQMGDPDNDSKYEQLYAFGARSFSVRDATGQLLFDSGNDFERLLAVRYPKGFAQTDITGSGPQPEGITTGRVGDRTFAFVALERSSSIFVYDVTNPEQPAFVQIVVNRDFDVTFGDLSGNPKNPARGGDFSPEGLEFIPAEESPIGNPLLAVGYAVSGTAAVLEIAPLPSNSGGSDADDEHGENDKDDDGDGATDEDNEDNEGPSNDDDDGDGAIDEDDEPDDGDDGSDDFNGEAEDDDDGDGAFDEDNEPDSGNSDDMDNDGDGAVDEDDEPDTDD